MSEKKDVNLDVNTSKSDVNSEWSNVKDHGKPEAGRRVQLRLYAEYEGSWEPEEGQNKKGQWFLDAPTVNTSEWKYVHEKDVTLQAPEDI